MMNATFKMRAFHCDACGQREDRLAWNYDPAPICCDRAMSEGGGARQTVQIITDGVPGGFTVENGFSSPQTFYDKSEHRHALETGRRADGTRVGRGGLRIADRGEIRH